MRAAIKTAAATGLHLSGAARLLGNLNGCARSLVVCYHRVVEDLRAHSRSAPAMLISVATLERQLDWIGRRYRFVGLDELAARQAGEVSEDTDRPLAAVTFDDGYADVFHHALPLLRRKGIPATFFVTSAALEGELERFQHDELYALLCRGCAELGVDSLSSLLRQLGVSEGCFDDDRGPSARELIELNQRLLVRWSWQRIGGLIATLHRAIAGDSESAEGPHSCGPSLMTWEMLRQICAAGFMVGSHTRSHRILPLESAETVRAELLESRRALERGLGIEISHLAYPNGRFSADTLQAAADAGYRYAYTTCSHRDPARPQLTIPRRCLWERSAAGAARSFFAPMAACEFHGVFDLLRPCREEHGRLPEPADEATARSSRASRSPRTSGKSFPVAPGAGTSRGVA
jgi:peptidoglycan/xylan/chitin deacetylase (PgdA/CDA1 family)